MESKEIGDCNLAQNVTAIELEKSRLDPLIFQAVGKMFTSYYYIKKIES